MAYIIRSNSPKQVLGGLAYAANDVVDQFTKSRMGVSDGQMTTATPRMDFSNKPRSFQDNGGATGDLVFSSNCIFQSYRSSCTMP